MTASKNKPAMTVAELIVGDDTEAMRWWQFECRFGDNPMQAAIHGKKMRLISSLKQLAALIAE